MATDIHHWEEEIKKKKKVMTEARNHSLIKNPRD